jgi:SMI1 / KNR4 family (SUKH-1)
LFHPGRELPFAQPSPMAFPVSEQRIEAAERELGRRLLPEHRARLQRNNGGEVACDDDAWQLHPVWDDSDRRTIARTTGHIVHETEEALNRVNFPSDAIAIASDGSGNLLVVRFGSPRVERWDHETGECSPVSVDWESPAR